MKAVHDHRAVNCTRCPRLQQQFATLRDQFPDYWNRPVGASGDPAAQLLILGLAPGLHGANRTGIPFTGDASGELLFATLDQLGIRDQVRISNAIKCLPVQNKPSTSELNNCADFLSAELDEHFDSDSAVVLALGRVAHERVIRHVVGRQSEFPFKHGKQHRLPGGTFLVDSYHCSRYNTQTGRLTPRMFLSAVRKAAKRASLEMADA